MKAYDYIIVGAGIAGLYAALLAQRHGSVVVITKGSVDECNTKYAQGGIAAAIGSDDSPELHLKDTLVAGAGLGGGGGGRTTPPPGPPPPAPPPPAPTPSRPSPPPPAVAASPSWSTAWLRRSSR